MGVENGAAGTGRMVPSVRAVLEVVLVPAGRWFMVMGPKPSPFSSARLHPAMRSSTSRPLALSKSKPARGSWGYFHGGTTAPTNAPAGPKPALSPPELTVTGAESHKSKTRRDRMGNSPAGFAAHEGCGISGQPRKEEVAEWELMG